MQNLLDFQIAHKYSEKRKSLTEACSFPQISHL